MTESKKHQSPASRTSPLYCGDCGFKIRGKGHYEGQHHISGKKGRCQVGNK